MTEMRDAAALLGALVADAAALGLHWLYDVERIAELTKEREAAFFPLDAAAYDGAKGIFVHHAREDGQLSQYGETLALALRSIAAQGGFDVPAYQQAYADHFGAGGDYNGYIDRPTKGTLAQLAANQTDPSGVDDDQHPAISTLPAIVARYSETEGFETMATAAMQVTNVNESASLYGNVFVRTLEDVTSGTPLKDALRSAATGHADLSAALDTAETDPIAYGETTQRACHLSQGVPLTFHILANTTSYRDAIDANIRAGGDSCGRAIMVGALAGAAYGEAGIPLEWTLSLQNAADLWALCQTVACKA